MAPRCPAWPTQPLLVEEREKEREKEREREREKERQRGVGGGKRVGGAERERERQRSPSRFGGRRDPLVSTATLDRNRPRQVIMSSRRPPRPGWWNRDVSRATFKFMIR